jgi:hypothetical protein
MEGPEASLPLKGNVNPKYADAITAFVEKAVKPIIGEFEELKRTDYAKVKAAFSPFRAWGASNPVMNAGAKAMLGYVVLEQFPQKTLFSASGMAGFDSGNAIRTRKVTGRFYLCGDGKSDVDQDIGLTAPRVMLCAAHQALTVIRLILGEKDV